MSRFQFKRRRWFIIVALVACLVLITGSYVQAHPGRTNSAGCHNDRQNGGYHCHGSGSSGSGSSGSGSSQRNTPYTTPSQTTPRPDPFTPPEVILPGTSYSSPCPFNTEEFYKSFMNAGYKLTAAKEYEMALECFQNALKIKPASPYAIQAVQNVQGYIQNR